MEKYLKQRLFIDKNSEIASYIQIANQLKQLIREGMMPEGTRLSERELADTYGISRSTITFALDILKEEGFIETVPRSGTFVKNNIWDSFMTGSVPDWKRYLERGVFPSSRKEFIQYHEEDKKPGSHTGLHASYSPHLPLRKAYADLAADPDLEVKMNQNDPMGLPELRRTLKKHLHQQGIKTEIHNIVVFPGYVEALYTISLALLNQGANVYCMQGDHMALVPIFPAVGANVYVIPYDDEGPIPQAFEKLIKPGRLNILCINPVNSYPLGITYTEKRLQQLKDIALKYNIPIIENVFYRDFWITPPPPSLKALDSHNQIIYISTNSNSYSTGAHLAWAVLPDMIVKRVCCIKTFLNTMNNCSNEYIIHTMLSRGYYSGYMEELRARLTDIIDRYDRILNTHLKGLAVWKPENMMFTTWLELVPGADINRVIAENPYHISSGKPLTGQANSIFLYTLAITPEEFEEAVRYIAISLKRQF